jgi:hypothetical protein
MNPSHPIQEQIKKLLDDHGVQILAVWVAPGHGLTLDAQDVVSHQKTTIVIPFGKRD